MFAFAVWAATGGGDALPMLKNDPGGGGVCGDGLLWGRGGWCGGVVCGGW